MAKISKKTKPQKAKVRKYNNASRREKSDEAQYNVLQSYIALLTERRGADVGMDEVAKRAGISERTVFRFFKDKKALQSEVNKFINTYLEYGYRQIEEVDVTGFAKNIFAAFDRNESFTLAYIYSPFGQDSRRKLRKSLHDRLIEKITKSSRSKLPPEELKRLAVVFSLINARVWDDIKNDFGFSGEEMSESVEWAIKTLLAHYRVK